ncbi:hypothetical protein [Pseudomonas sp. LB1P83]
MDGRKPGFDAYAIPMLKGFLHPTTEFSVTIKGYRLNSLRTSSWKPPQLEGNLRWIYTASNAEDFAGARSEKKPAKDDDGVGQFPNTPPPIQEPSETQTWREVSLTPRLFFGQRWVTSQHREAPTLSASSRKKTGRIYFFVHLHPQACGHLDASQLAEMASQAKHHGKNVPGYSVHVIDSLAVPVQNEELIIGQR